MFANSWRLGTGSGSSRRRTSSTERPSACAMASKLRPSQATHCARTNSSSGQGDCAARWREVGLHGSIGRQRKHGAAVLSGIELLAHAPPGFRALVVEAELAVASFCIRLAGTLEASDRNAIVLEARNSVAAPAAINVDN